MRIYATELRTDHVMIVSWVHDNGYLVEREVLIDNLRQDTDGNFVVVEGYFGDNGDDYTNVHDLDDEINVRA